MGFGILLIGFLLSVNNYPGYFDCFAYFIIFYALLKLGEYNKFFRIAKYISFCMTVLGMAGLMLNMSEVIGIVDETNMFIDIYDNVSEGIKVIFHFFLLAGIVRISKDTELYKLSERATWFITLDLIYGVLFILVLAVPFSGQVLAVLLSLRMVLRLVYMLLIAYLIFSCYRMICLEGDEDMPEENSRFEFVNKFRRALREKAERGNRKGMETEEYKRRQAEAKKNGVDLSKKFTESKKKR